MESALPFAMAFSFKELRAPDLQGEWALRSRARLTLALVFSGEACLFVPSEQSVVNWGPWALATGVGNSK